VKRYIISPEAAEDLKEIRAYLKREAGPRVVTTTILKITAAFVLLSRTPGAGHTREDLTGSEVKFWSVFSYMVVYDPTKIPVEIVRVIHGNRDLRAVLGSDDE
jgi:plasmid stabilization system protein ParE